MPTIPFLSRRTEAGPASGRTRSVRPTARLHEPGTHAWTTVEGPDALDLIWQSWPRHASRVGILLGSDLDPHAIEVLRAVRRILGVVAVDRADGACHAPATAVIDAALGRALLAPDDLVQADCIVCIGDPALDDQQLEAQLLTARAAGVPILALAAEPPLSATASIPVTGDDIASFVQATVRALLADGDVDRQFINVRTYGFEQFLADLEADATPSVHTSDAQDVERLRAFTDYVRNAERLAIVWQPGTERRDAMVARALIGMLLVRGSVGRPGSGLCVVGPVAALHPADCCAMRSGGVVGSGAPVTSGLGIVARAQLGDIDTLITVGRRPFSGLDRRLEREALEGIAVHLHVGTIGADALPVLHTPVVVLPGPVAARLADLVAAIEPSAIDELPTDVVEPAPVTREYTFVARAVGDTRRHAS